MPRLTARGIGSPRQLHGVHHGMIGSPLYGRAAAIGPLALGSFAALLSDTAILGVNLSLVARSIFG